VQIDNQNLTEGKVAVGLEEFQRKDPIDILWKVLDGSDAFLPIIAHPTPQGEARRTDLIFLNTITIIFIVIVIEILPVVIREAWIFIVRGNGRRRGAGVTSVLPHPLISRPSHHVHPTLASPSILLQDHCPFQLGEFHQLLEHTSLRR
jgi:hypothetical protein